VRKLSGFNKPSRANEAAFNHAVEEVAAVARNLIDALVTTASPRDRISKRRVPVSGLRNGLAPPPTNELPYKSLGATPDLP